MLSQLLPCACGCSHFCLQALDGACKRCGHAAVDHGQLVGEDAINEKIKLLLQVAKKLAAVNQPKEGQPSGMSRPDNALLRLLEPIEISPPTNEEPPFESPTIEQLAISFIRFHSFSSTDSKPQKDLYRKVISYALNVINSPGFFKTYYGRAVQENSLETDPIVARWRQWGHQCAADKLCRVCVEDQESKVQKSTRKASETFGEQFLSQCWTTLLFCLPSILERAPGLPVEAALNGFRAELLLGSSSVIFSSDAWTRLALMQPLQSLSREKAAALTTAGTLGRVASQDHIASLSPSTKKLRGAEAETALTQGNALEVRVVTDSKNSDGWMLLVGLKEVISKQLPEMPKSYIMRALFDGNHQSLCVSKHGKVVGGCTFRPLVKQNFVEVVFLAVNPNTMSKGLGSLIMSEVKTYSYTELKVEYLLTYADNTAIEFFKKQGFQRDVTLARSKWSGYIKDYTKATLMEYHIAPQRDAAITQQAQWIKACVTAVLTGYEVKEGLAKRTVFPVKPKAIGVQADEHLQSRMKRIVLVLKRFRYITPFLKPVNPEEAPRYTEIVKHPMSLEDVERKLDNGEYTAIGQFERDLKQIAINAQTYNDESSWYYKHAEKLMEMITKNVS